MKFIQKKITTSFKSLINYLTYKEIFARVVHDQSVQPLLPELKGLVLELGAGIHDYSVFATSCDEYIRSDFYGDNATNRIAIDATNINFPDNKFDSIVCMSALEHIEDFEKVLSEINRILKPGGKLLLNVPWLFPFHGAPNDFYRFSSSALHNKLCNDYDIEVFQSVGNFWLSQAVFLQRPTWSRTEENKNNKVYDVFLRLIGIAFILTGCKVSKDRGDDNYSLLYCMLCIKK